MFQVTKMRCIYENRLPADSEVKSSFTRHFLDEVTETSSADDHSITPGNNSCLSTYVSKIDCTFSLPYVEIDLHIANTLDSSDIQLQI